jgi:putative ABC transport system ATP-binding protein
LAFIEFSGVVKEYETGGAPIRAADGVDFAIEEGEFVIIVGSSGAGKTTVLNILGGMDNATAGSVTVGGQEITAFDNRQLIHYRRHKVGFVFQFYNLIPNLTALENIDIAAELSRHPLPASFVLEEVGLSERAGNFPAQLSGGEQQRVSIARALAKNPSLLLCDEPTGALDYITGKQILTLLQDTCLRTGTTVVVITHNAALEPMADRVIRMRSGKVTDMTVNPMPADAADIEW